MWHEGLKLAFFVAVLICLIPILGSYMANVFTGQRTFAHPFLEWLENVCYRIAGVNPIVDMNWIGYLKALLLFNACGFAVLFFLLLAQGSLPLNPQHFPGTSWPLAFNTAASFMTNTNWQSYAGETTLSYFTQMLGLAVQNFLSASTGMGALLVLSRGFVRRKVDTIGNFWVDLVRMNIYVLLPLSIILALLLVSQGVVQSFSSYTEVGTLEKGKQIIPVGPVASQIAIKQLGTNGGGFFNTNSAHPFENPTAFSNFLEMLALVLIPASSVYMYGILTGARTHARVLLLAMFALWVIGLVISFCSELMHNPDLAAYPVWEGKETRLGAANSILWTVSTTATANGSVNTMISSLSPLAGGIALFNIMLGELIFGGVGVGLCSMIMFALLTVFLSGLMVGRTPEYLGNKIEKREMKWVMIAVLTPGALILIGAGLSAVIPEALSSLGNQGPHGLSEILYAFTSAAGNNGSAFAGLNANTDYYNLSLGVVMLLARLAILVPSLAIAGSIACKKIAPSSIGTFSTDTKLFFILLISVIIIVGALTFFPAMTLGPVVEHFLMREGRVF